MVETLQGYPCFSAVPYQGTQNLRAEEMNRNIITKTKLDLTMKWNTIKKILQIVATILTTIVGTVCVQSCVPYFF